MNIFHDRTEMRNMNEKTHIKREGVYMYRENDERRRRDYD